MGVGRQAGVGNNSSRGAGAALVALGENSGLHLLCGRELLAGPLWAQRSEPPGPWAPGLTRGNPWLPGLACSCWEQPTGSHRCRPHQRTMLMG